MDRPIRIATISDSPKITTGFGNVGAEIYKGFHEAGYEVSCFGMLDAEPDIDKKLPYKFWPTTPLDPMGHRTIYHFIHKVKPDVIFILVDPGNAITILENLGYSEDYNPDLPKVIGYYPVEGTPINDLHKKAFRITDLHGVNVFWANSSANNADREIGNIDTTNVINFGTDHAPFRRYTKEQRKLAREYAGLNNYFVIGSVGTNKRTKGFPQIIYTAQVLKLMGVKNVLFYLHTEPDMPTMGGYNLRSIAKAYNVADMVLFKPDVNQRDRGDMFTGVERTNNLFKDIENNLVRFPETKEERVLLFGCYDYITRMNCLDLYLDLSEIEGWGMPVMEAMACGVPTMVLNDGDVREELFIEGGYPLVPLPRAYWTTWNTGSRLVNVDPYYVAKEILEVKADTEGLAFLSNRGQEHVSKFKWSNAREAMNKVVKEIMND